MLIIEKATLIYKSLLTDLPACPGPTTSFAATVSAYRSAENHWQDLRRLLAVYHFTGIDEEIIFFKTIKPLFLEFLEYYPLLSYAQSFCPVELSAADIKNFWLRQASRLDNFCNKHTTFFHYHNNNKTAHDAELYTRSCPTDKNYQFDQTRSGYDLLAGRLLAHQRFHNDAIEKLLSEL